MAIRAAFIVPHPPLIVPQVGQGSQLQIQDTIDAYKNVAKQIGELAPETILLISPHAPSYSDYFHIAGGSQLRGDLSQFGGAQTIEASIDEELVGEICRICDEQNFPAGTLGGKDGKMDHGTFIPLYFVNQYYKDYRLVVCSLSGLPRAQHYRFGLLMQEAILNTKRKTIVIASGDLSHKLLERGPYGFAEEGPKLDAKLTDIMQSGNFLEFLTLDENLCLKGAECGLLSFVVMAGLLDQREVSSTLLSYQGTFGVGYGIAAFIVAGEDPSRNFGTLFKQEENLQMQEIRKNEDAYVNLARKTLEHYVRSDRLMPMPQELPQELLHEQAGVFVSIHKSGKLRGCIGTIGPVCESIAMEIMQNAISAGTRDSRFPSITKEEFEQLVYHVDVLSAAKPVTDRNTLDPKRFGVIVTCGHKRGVLLPDLEGVDTVDDQIAIACQKAGITAHEKYELEFFHVVRHT
ncbi:AmmeMemoRadiSam system protein A [Lachnospiraceae bacterium ZAX-1]